MAENIKYLLKEANEESKYMGGFKVCVVHTIIKATAYETKGMRQEIKLGDKLGPSEIMYFNLRISEIQSFR